MDAQKEMHFTWTWMFKSLKCIFQRGVQLRWCAGGWCSGWRPAPAARFTHRRVKMVKWESRSNWGKEAPTGGKRSNRGEYSPCMFSQSGPSERKTSLVWLSPPACPLVLEGCLTRSFTCGCFEMVTKKSTCMCAYVRTCVHTRLPCRAAPGSPPQSRLMGTFS